MKRLATAVPVVLVLMMAVALAQDSPKRNGKSKKKKMSIAPAAAEAVAAEAARLQPVDEPPAGPAGPVLQPPPLGPLGIRKHSLRLRGDGTLLGRLSVIDPVTNQLVPLARASAFFTQNCQLVDQFVTNAEGEFLARSLPPGVYSVVAQGPNAFGAFSVLILPFDERYGPDLLDATLIPLCDLACVAAPGGGGGAGAALIGGGGGGGGGGPFLPIPLIFPGDDDDDDNPPASPFTP